MPFFTLDPITDSRWDQLVKTHPHASVFHHSGWLKALSETYGYRPFVLTTNSPGESLAEGIAFCEIDSWITGRRIVSLPFADHTEPLLADGDVAPYMNWLENEAAQKRWKYIEFRPLSYGMEEAASLADGQKFWNHSLDLRGPLEQLFRGLHKDCLQRRIRKAEREQLTYERGCSDTLLEEFFQLQILTRRRHQLLPQPINWFRNLLKGMRGAMDIRVVRKDGLAIASIVTLYHNKSAVYKYGCSNEAFHKLAPMPFLFWKLIQEAKAEGMEELDFGRTELENEGLIRFKDQFGTARRLITYSRYPRTAKESNNVSPYLSLTGHLFAVLPDSLSSGLGRALYRHLG